MFFKKELFSLMILIFAVQPAVSSENPMLVRIEFSGETDINLLAGLRLDIPYVTGTFAEAVVYPDELKRLDAAGLGYQVIHEDLVRFYQSRNTLGLDMGGFPTFSEAVYIIDSLHNHYPSIVSAKSSIGISGEGRNLWIFKISDNVDTDENEPEVFYNALIHAREPAGITCLLYFAGWLCQNYGIDPVATEIVDNRELYFLPVLNPDGYEYNRITNPGGGGMWRKNRRNNGDGSYGVDLNRNWGYMWGYDDYGSSPYTYDEVYRGPSAFSEPEIQAIRQFIDSRPFAFIVNAHTYGGYLLYPWGYADIYTPDQDFFSSIGDSATTLVGYPHGTAWELLYNTNGDANDWEYGEQTEKPLIFCLSPEVGDDYDGFWPAPSRIPQLNQQMLPLGIYIAQLAGAMAGLAFEYPSGIPQTTTPGIPRVFDVIVSGVRGGIPIPGSGQLHHSIDGAPFITVNMNEISANHYEATLPALNCGSRIDFYITAEEMSAGVFSDPQDAPATTFSAIPVSDIIISFSDNFETNQGWTVIDSGGLTAGSWQRGVPAGGGVRGDPANDYDGSGQCYLTGNTYGDSDIDNGFTFLISPTLNLEGADGIIRYALWYTNNLGNDPNNDLFKTYVSGNNGASWTLVETIGPVTQGGWTEHSFRVNDFISPTAQVKIRFEAADTGAGSVVEAGIDAVEVEVIECQTTDVPTLYEWGMITMGLLLLATGTAAIIVRRSVLFDEVNHNPDYFES